MWNLDTWVGLGTLGAAIVGSVIAAYWQSRKPADDAGEEPYKRRAIIVRLDDDDRDRIDRLGRGMNRVGDVVDDHRRAIREQTAVLRRDGDADE